jgi:hypothetical protein
MDASADSHHSQQRKVPSTKILLARNISPQSAYVKFPPLSLVIGD